MRSGTKARVLASAALFGILAAMPGLAMADLIRITGREVNLRQGPGKSYAVVRRAAAGDEFPLVREEGLWYLVSLGDGAEAYVFGQFARRLGGNASPQAPGAAGSGLTRDQAHPVGRGIFTPWFAIPFLVIVAGLCILKRRELVRFMNAQLKERSGYRRGNAFRYDDHPPEDDHWEI